MQWPATPRCRNVFQLPVQYLASVIMGCGLDWGKGSCGGIVCTNWKSGWKKHATKVGAPHNLSTLEVFDQQSVSSLPWRRFVAFFLSLNTEFMLLFTAKYICVKNMLQSLAGNYAVAIGQLEIYLMRQSCVRLLATAQKYSDRTSHTSASCVCGSLSSYLNSSWNNDGKPKTQSHSECKIWSRAPHLIKRQSFSGSISNVSGFSVCGKPLTSTGMSGQPRLCGSAFSVLQN